MDVPLAEPIADALHQAVDRGDTSYPPGRRAYAEALSGFAARRWGWARRTAGGPVSELAGPAPAFLDQARVALSSGHVFGSGGAGHVRLNFATSQAVLTEALTRMGHCEVRRSR